MMNSPRGASSSSLDSTKALLKAFTATPPHSVGKAISVVPSAVSTVVAEENAAPNNAVVALRPPSTPTPTTTAMRSPLAETKASTPQQQQQTSTTTTMMSTNRRQQQVQQQQAQGQYEIVFPAGPMGLELEPVIISSERQLGCRVKDFYFGLDHTGIDQDLVMSKVSIGDVISHINGQVVLSLRFAEILELLRSYKDTTRTVIFKNLYASWTGGNRGAASSPRSPTPVRSRPPPRTSAALLLSTAPSNLEAYSIVQPVTPAASFNTPVKSPRPSSSSASAALTVSPRAVRDLRTRQKQQQQLQHQHQQQHQQQQQKPLEAITRALGLHMHEGEVTKKHVLLNELSRSCVLLGIAEEKQQHMVEQLEEKTRALKSTEESLHDAEALIESMRYELTLLATQRDTTSLTATAADAETRIAYDEVARERQLREQALENTQELKVFIGELRDELEQERIKSGVLEEDVRVLREDLTAERLARGREQVTFKEELDRLVSEQRETHGDVQKEFTHALERLQEAERSRDVAQAEVDVLRDLAQNDQVGVQRLRESLVAQSEWHKEYAATKEEELDALRQRVKSLEETADHMLKRKEEALRTLGDTQEDTDELRASIAQLKAELRLGEERLSSANFEFACICEENGLLKGELERAMRALEERDEERDDEAARREQTTVRIAELEREGLELRNSLEASRETAKDLDLRLRCAEANLVSAGQAASLEAQDAAQAAARREAEARQEVETEAKATLAAALAAAHEEAQVVLAKQEAEAQAALQRHAEELQRVLDQAAQARDRHAEELTRATEEAAAAAAAAAAATESAAAAAAAAATEVAKLQAQRHTEELQAAVEAARLEAAAEARRHAAQLTQTQQEAREESRQAAQRAHAEVAEAWAEVAQKQALITEALAELEQKKATIVELQATIAEALSELEQHKATTAEQQAAMAALQASLADHSQLLLNSQAKVAQKKATIAEQQEAIRAALALQAEAEVVLGEQASSLDAARATISELKAAEAQSAAALDEKTTELESQKRILASVQGRVRGTCAELSAGTIALRIELTETRSALLGLIDHNAQLTHAFAAAESEKQSLKAEMAAHSKVRNDVNVRAAQLVQQLLEAEAANQALNSLHVSLTVQHADCVKQFDELSAVSESMSSELADLRLRCEEQRVSYEDKLREERAHHDAVLEGFRAERARILGSYEHMLEESRRCTLKAATHQHEQYELKLKAVREEEMLKAQQLGRSWDEEREKLFEEMDLLRAARDEEMERMMEEKELLKTACASAEHECKLLQSLVSTSVESTRDAADRFLQKAKRDMKELEAECARGKAERDNLSRELEIVSRELSESAGAAAQAKTEAAQARAETEQAKTEAAQARAEATEQARAGAAAGAKSNKEREQIAKERDALAAELSLLKGIEAQLAQSRGETLHTRQALLNARAELDALHAQVTELLTSAMTTPTPTPSKVVPAGRAGAGTTNENEAPPLPANPNTRIRAERERLEKRKQQPLQELQEAGGEGEGEVEVEGEEEDADASFDSATADWHDRIVALTLDLHEALVFALVAAPGSKTLADASAALHALHEHAVRAPWVNLDTSSPLQMLPPAVQVANGLKSAPVDDQFWMIQQLTQATSLQSRQEAELWEARAEVETLNMRLAMAPTSPTDRLATLLDELSSLVKDHDDARALKKILAKYQNQDGAAAAAGAVGAGEDNNNSDFWDVSNSIDDLEEEAGALAVALEEA